MGGYMGMCEDMGGGMWILEMRWWAGWVWMQLAR